jgi:hypothetical protein
MLDDTQVVRTDTFRNILWTLDSKAEQPPTNEALNQSMLFDIRSYLRSIRAMLLFFTVISIVGICLLFIEAIVK